MSGAFQLGPLAIPYAVLLVLAAMAATLAVGWRVGRQVAAEVESLLWQSMVAGFVVARLAYVWEFRDQYFASPLSVLDIRDGGWSPVGGAAATALVALLRQWRRPHVRDALWSGLAAGAVVWGLGALAFSIAAGDRQRLPAVALVSLQGEPVNLSAFAGKPVVVNLWATWCPPCVREMPVLQQAQAGHPAIHFVFVNVREPRERVQGWLQSRRLPLRNVLLDQSGEVAATFGAPGLPTTLFFDAGGVLVGTRVGELSAATLAERLRAIR